MLTAQYLKSVKLSVEYAQCRMDLKFNALYGLHVSLIGMLYFPAIFHVLDELDKPWNPWAEARSLCQRRSGLAFAIAGIEQHGSFLCHEVNTGVVSGNRESGNS